MQHPRIHGETHPVLTEVTRLAPVPSGPNSVLSKTATADPLSVPPRGDVLTGIADEPAN
jgi:hypothetical protein